MFKKTEIEIVKFDFIDNIAGAGGEGEGEGGGGIVWS